MLSRRGTSYSLSISNTNRVDVMGLKLCEDAAADIVRAQAMEPFEGYLDPKTQEMVVPPGFEGLTNFEAVVKTMYRSAIAGDTKAASSILDRLMGRPKQRIEETSTVSFVDYLSTLPDSTAAPEEISPE